MRAFAIAAGMTALVAGLGYALVPAPQALLHVPGPRAPGGAAEAAAAPSNETPAAAQAAASVPAEALPARAGKHIFYQWVDDHGVVRFARTRDEVPPAWRERAGQVEVDDHAFAPKAAEPRTQPARRPAAGRAERPRLHDVTVYTAPWCGWCRKTLAWLDERGVDYVNKDIEADDDWAEELEERSGGHSIPYVLIDGSAIRGYSPGKMAALLD